MIGLDTNVLVRVLVRDDAAMAERAERAIRERCSADAPGYINHIVLCELVWVLDRVYGYSREQITTLLDALCRAADFQVQGIEIVKQAIKLLRTGREEFADCLIDVINKAAGCESAITFEGSIGLHQRAE